jgi:hypothetical protein
VRPSGISPCYTSRLHYKPCRSKIRPVFGKEIYKEVVSLLKPSKEAGEAESGELLGAHSDYLNGRLTRAVHELATLFRKKGYRALPLPPVGPSDQRFLTSLLSYKHVAALAGLGYNPTSQLVDHTGIRFQGEIGLLADGSLSGTFSAIP